MVKIPTQSHFSFEFEFEKVSDDTSRTLRTCVSVSKPQTQSANHKVKIMEVQKSLHGKQLLEANRNTNRIVIFDLMRKTYHVDELKSGIANWILQSYNWLRVKRIVQAGINYQLE